jgi:hypothetical protein
MSKATPSGALGCLVGSRWVRMLFEHFNFIRGSCGRTLLAASPSMGEMGSPSQIGKFEVSDRVLLSAATE